MPVRIDNGTLMQVKKMFETLEGEVKIRVFVTDENCQYCDDTLELVKKVGSLSPLIKVEECNCSTKHEFAKKYKIDKHPAILIHGQKEYGIRYFGIPAGFEFGSLIEDIVDVSKGKTQLSEGVEEAIRKIEKPVHIMIFVTPTCPYCPIAVRTAHKFALLNLNITADMIEAMEFGELANRYAVMAVPKIIINDKVSFEGAVPDHLFAHQILEALKGD